MIAAAERRFLLRYRSPGYWLEIFRTYYGPMLKTFTGLDAATRIAGRRIAAARAANHEHSEARIAELPFENPGALS